MKPQLLSLALIVACPPLAAQDFPHPQPTDAHKVLKAEEGTWDAVVKMYFQGAGGPATEYKGVETIEMVSGGLFSKSSFTCKFGEREFEGHGLFGYDPKSEEYTGTWVDNFNAAPTHMTGTYGADTKTLTYLSTVDDGAGNELKQKQVTTFVDDKTRRFEVYMQIDQGGQTLDVKLMEIATKKRD